MTLGEELLLKQRLKELEQRLHETQSHNKKLIAENQNLKSVIKKHKAYGRKLLD